VTDFEEAQEETLSATEGAASRVSERQALTTVKVHLRETQQAPALAQAAPNYAESRQSSPIDLTTSDTLVLEDSLSAATATPAEASTAASLVLQSSATSLTSVEQQAVLASGVGEAGSEVVSTTTARSLQSVSFVTKFAQVLAPFGTCAAQAAQLVQKHRRFSVYMSAPGYVPDTFRYLQFTLMGYTKPVLPSLNGAATSVAHEPGALSTTHVSAPNDRRELFFPADNDKVYFYVASVEKVTDSTSLAFANLHNASSTVATTPTSGTPPPTLQEQMAASCRAHLVNNLVEIQERSALSGCANFRSAIFQGISDPSPALRGRFEEVSGSVEALAEGTTHELPPAVSAGDGSTASANTG
ncbi:unnamed protein product, partial [Amoebophrya sp. A120]